MREEPRPGVEHRDAGLVARGFDAQDAHCGEYTGALPARIGWGNISGYPFNFTQEQPMPSVRVRENEPFEAALRRFKRTIEKTGLLTELRAREFYEKPTAERKRKKAAAVKRHYKRIRSQQLPPKLF